MVTKNLIEKLFPKGKRHHFKILAAMATAIMGVTMIIALWSAARGDGRLFTVSIIICLAMMAIAKDCDEASGNTFGS